MTKNIDTISAAVAIIIKAAILAASFSGRVRKRSLKRLTKMNIDNKDKEILFLHDRVYQLKLQILIWQKSQQKKQNNRYTIQEKLFTLLLYKHIMPYVTMHVGESNIATAVTIRKQVVIDAKLMQHCCPQFIHSRHVLLGAVAEFICGTIDGAAFNAAAGKPCRKSLLIVIASVALGKGVATKFVF